MRPTLLSLNRDHWSIENRFHWIQDIPFDEDRCHIRKGAGGQVMAGLRNLAISLLRMAGATYIAKALRYWVRQGL
ncbi:MAG: transposase family protein, partial [Acidobacteria bacterium]|nr:transposase family protein [Acidobacteriota bacterium]